MAISELNFADILDWAQAAAATYDDDSVIRDKYGPSTRIKSLDNGVKVFVAVASSKRFQWLAIRGTADFLNLREDAEYLKQADPRLGVYLHSGFYRDARAVYEETRAQLAPGVPVRVAGHSLGAAIAVILQAWLHADGHPVDATITFGQPKLTNEAGVIKLREQPVLRVINDEDMVPMLPPLTLLSAQRGPYRHFGRELHLGPVPPLYRLYSEHDAETPAVGSFWRHLGDETPRDHHVGLYVAKLQAFRETLSDAHQPASSLSEASSPAIRKSSLPKP